MRRNFTKKISSAMISSMMLIAAPINDYGVVKAVDVTESNLRMRKHRMIGINISNVNINTNL